MKTAVSMKTDGGVFMIVELEDPSVVLVFNHMCAPRVEPAFEHDFLEGYGWEVFG